MPLQLERQGAIALLTLNRPDKLNALSPEMGQRLKEAVETLRSEPEVRVVVLGGAGRSFSAGGDLGMLEANADQPFERNRTAMRAFYAAFLAIRQLEVPTIAMVQGRATGAGLALACACDLRVAAEDAVFAANFVRLGLNPGMGLSYHLQHLVGSARAKELVLTGRDVEMGEALAIGLVNHLVRCEDLLAATLQLAEMVAANAPVAVRLAKQVLDLERSTLDEVLAAEAEGQARCFATADLKEGLAAIRQKRQARFSGD